jgi:hypothetical protein
MKKPTEVWFRSGQAGAQRCCAPTWNVVDIECS